ncbi:hypothetical protein [Paenibacillus sp. 1781tsa1]|uniref:hypothetical protein n=1 Tax=Paenibacillus sp. 1781tsa1 TaxID=2953810 RepID=UPI00209F12A2|nr:hypothetical protein [Paenibacillus sp. 1781tsa1]MCP1185059.1 hypothetical protein [Paenibacillus sp. 1781tsa1]
MGSKAILKNRTHNLELMITEKRSVKDILTYANFIRKKLIENQIFDTESIDKVISEVLSDNCNMKKIGVALDELDKLIETT